MRLAIVANRLFRDSALDASPLSVERLDRWRADGWSIEVFLDQESEGSLWLRDRGVERINLALRRPVEGPAGESMSSDRIQARLLATRHRVHPFDAILYDSDVVTDLAWWEPELAALPRGVAAGRMLARLRAVWGDPDLFPRLGRRYWALLGWLESADFIVSDVPLESYGLATPGSAPRLGTGAPPPRQAASAGDPAWIVVAATTMGARQLERLPARILQCMPRRRERLYVVLCRERGRYGRDPAEAILAGCPKEIERQLLVIPVADDGVARDFLARADLVLTASMAELGIAAVAETAAERGWIPLTHETTVSPASPLCRENLPHPRRVPDLHVVTWETDRRILETALGTLEDFCGADDLMLIHDEQDPGPGAHFVGLDRYAGVDVVVWAHPDPLLGQPDPWRLSPRALAVRGDLLPAVREALRVCGSLRDLVRWAVNQEWMDRLRLLVLPASPDDETFELHEEPARTWMPLTAEGLPTPRWMVDRAPASEHPAPPPVRPPYRYVLPQRSGRRDVGLLEWVRREPWSRRARLALPWRWGLLERALRRIR